MPLWFPSGECSWRELVCARLELQKEIDFGWALQVERGVFVGVAGPRCRPEPVEAFVLGGGGIVDGCEAVLGVAWVVVTHVCLVRRKFPGLHENRFEVREVDWVLLTGYAEHGVRGRKEET